MAQKLKLWARSSLPRFSTLQFRITPSSTSMRSEWSYNHLMAFEISDYTAGNSDQRGFRFLNNFTSRFEAGMITSYFPSERSVIIAYTSFNPSGRCANSGDKTHTSFKVIFWNQPSFYTSIISPMDFKTFLIAGHTATSAVAGSLCRQKLLLSESSLFAVEP